MNVDDGLMGGSAEQVARMVGQKLPDGTFSQIMALGNYKIKAITLAGTPKSVDCELMVTRSWGTATMWRRTC